MRVLIDMDGVVMDMLGAIKSNFSDFQPQAVTEYDFHCECGIPREIIKRTIIIPDTFSRQQVYTSADVAILLLKQHGIETWAYTEVAGACMEVRNSQIKTLGLEGEAYAYGQKPVNLEGFDAIFEDCTATLDKWTNGIRKYIIDRPYNQDCRDAIRCKDLLTAVFDFIAFKQQR